MLGEEAQWADWMRAANAGDSGAYRRLLEALAPFLRKVVRQGFIRAGLGSGDMEDVVQETLLAIHLKRQTWDADQLFTPWLRAIARNKLIDNLRRRGNRTELPIEDFVDVLPASPPRRSFRRGRRTGSCPFSAGGSRRSCGRFAWRAAASARPRPGSGFRKAPRAWPCTGA